MALFLIILPFVSLSASTCPRLQVYPRLHLILGHSGPHPCDITWHFFPFYPQRDASPSHVAPLCPGGSWPQLGGNFLGGHPHLHMVSNSNLWGEADASGNVYWLGFSFWLTWKSFWICFCCSFSLFGVCLMAFYQAQFILHEFSAPSSRSNHNSVLSRENGSVNNITPNGVQYVDFSSSFIYVDQS